MRNGRSVLDRHFDAQMEMMESDPLLKYVYEKIKNCHPGKRCGHHDCRHCGKPFSDTLSAGCDNQYEVTVCDPYEVFADDISEFESGNYPKRKYTGNARLDHGERCHNFWVKYHERGVFTTTINIDLLPFNEFTNPFEYGDAITKRVKQFRKDLKNICEKHFPHIKYLGWFEDLIVEIEEKLKFHIQDQSWWNNADYAKYAVKLHVHMMIAGVSQEEFDAALKKDGFGASQQVRSAKLKPVKIVRKKKKGHARGWGEYMAKMFQLFKFKKDNHWIRRFHAHYRTKFTKSHRLLSRGINRTANQKLFEETILPYGPSYDQLDPEEWDQWKNQISGPIAFLKPNEMEPTPDELVDPLTQFEELTDPPEEYEYIPKYGVPQPLDTFISWNTVPEVELGYQYTKKTRWIPMLLQLVLRLLSHSLTTLVSHSYNSQLSNPIFSNGLKSKILDFLDREFVSFRVSCLAQSMRRRE